MTMEPTREQVANWITDVVSDPTADEFTWNVARLAYAAGADAELEACVTWVRGIGLISDSIPPSGLIPHLYRARRPKPPSLKQQALDELKELDLHNTLMPSQFVSTEAIRLAIASLPDD
jgi:hypothetical protein